MGTTMKTGISPFRQLKAEPNANLIQFLDEDLTLVPTLGIPEEFLKLSRFLPVIVLVPKSAVSDKTRPGAGTTNNDGVCQPLDAARAWIASPSDADAFAFGRVKVRFSTMEIYRSGQPVTLTCKEFKALAYFIKNPRKVISRDELLNEVWGYENYPSTRTVDNHILKLRQKLETEPAHPKHFHTVHSVGYKFLP
jgi:DNA-binding response OmpR family regulator